MLGSKATVPEHVVFRTFEAETLLLNLESGQYHGLNATGGRMLGLLKETDGEGSGSGERLAQGDEMGPGANATGMAGLCPSPQESGPPGGGRGGRGGPG